MPTPYKQTDSRWNKTKLGFGNTTIGQGGCTICCIGYLHNLITGDDLTPPEVNQRLKDAGAFIMSSVLWKRNGIDYINRAFPELQFVYRDWNYHNPTVWSWINLYPRLPVLVENMLPGSVSGKHWRLFVGGMKCYNPLSGAVEPTSVYKTLTGSARFKKI